MNCMHFQSFCFSGKNSLFLSSKLEVVRNFPNDDVLNAKRLKPRGGQYNAVVSVANFYLFFQKIILADTFKIEQTCFYSTSKVSIFQTLGHLATLQLLRSKLCLCNRRKEGLACREAFRGRNSPKGLQNLILLSNKADIRNMMTRFLHSRKLH